MFEKGVRKTLVYEQLGILKVYVFKFVCVLICWVCFLTEGDHVEVFKCIFFFPDIFSYFGLLVFASSPMR